MESAGCFEMNSGGFTQLPNCLWDMDITIYERVVLVHIIRKTVGWGKLTDGISLSQFVGDLGISKYSVLKALKSLEMNKIITKTPQKKPDGSQSFNRYGMHKNIINIVNDTVVRETNRGSASDEQGVVRETNRGSASDEQTKDTSTKDTNTIYGENPNTQKNKRFCKPSVDDINKYLGDENIRIDADRFYDFYESKNWMVGKNKMKCWKSSVRNWARNDFNKPGSSGSSIDDNDLSWMEDMKNDRF